MSRGIVRDDIDKFFDYEIYLPTRTIYLGSVSYEDGEETGTDHQMSERAIKGLHILDKNAPAGDKPITIIMNNDGGDTYHGFAIYDAVLRCRNHVTIIGTGNCMSMGSVILQAADERILTPNAKFMIHYCTWGIHGVTKTAARWADEAKKLDQSLVDIYLEKIRVKHPTFTREKVDKLLNFDTILTAQEAVDLGLADKVE